MTPLELKTEQEWTKILQNFSDQVGMPASLRDEVGNVLIWIGESYPLCKKIREDHDTLIFICSQTNAAMLNEVRKKLTPLIDFCDVGLIRIVVPIVREGELIGYVTSCGQGSEDEDIETFVVSMQLGITEEEAERLASFTPLSREKYFTKASEDLFEELN